MNLAPTKSFSEFSNSEARMTHSPHIPSGNTSPYPLQEPPHPQRDAALAALPVVANDRTPAPRNTGMLLGIGAAAGAGLALAGGLYYLVGRRRAA